MGGGSGGCAEDQVMYVVKLDHLVRGYNTGAEISFCQRSEGETQGRESLLGAYVLWGPPSYIPDRWLGEELIMPRSDTLIALTRFIRARAKSFTKRLEMTDYQASISHARQGRKAVIVLLELCSDFVRSEFKSLLGLPVSGNVRSHQRSGRE